MAEAALATMARTKQNQRRDLLLGAVLAASSLAPSPRAGAQEQPLEALATHARENRRDLDAQTSYAIALMRRERFRQARSVLEAARRLDSDGRVIPFEIARVAFTEGSYHRTRAACRRMMETRPALGHVCRARAFLLRQRAARAFEELDAAIELAPDEFEAWLALGDAHRLRASVTDAERAYRRAIALDERSSFPHAGLGHLYVSSDRTDDAIRALRRALRLDPSDPETLYALGRLVEGTEREELLARAVSIRPRWSEALTEYGFAQRTSGHREAALRSLLESVSVNSRQANAHVGIGQLHLEAGRHRDAQTAFERALVIVPNSAIARRGLAETHEAAGRHEQAFTAYREAGDLDTTNPDPLLRAARLALREGRGVLAIAFLDRTLERHPNLAAALALYGDALRARRDATGARRYYERALRGEGAIDRPQITEALRSLEGIASSAPVR